MNFAIGGIIAEGDNGDRVHVELIEASSTFEAIGKFFHPFMGKQDFHFKNFTVRSDAPGTFLDLEDKEIVEHLKQRKRINAIKRRRELTGEDLRTAKDYCDRLYEKMIEEGVIKQEPKEETPF
jgi:hypothetical protein